jgi:DNA polymerase-3 subunit gamma/tau
MADAPFVSLYRRFRPGRFDEIRGQDHVVRALRSAVRDERVQHAYLFSGPRGTGKTSSARILAKALNCAAPVDGEPCGVCASCVEIAQGNSLNVHELDAASNNGVDAMRDLVAHAGLGTPGRWKVYIVDEVHMLSPAAANALLKTLEEPPGHVVFVLATTDPQKVPPTIRSRTQHLEFRLLGAETLQGLVASVNDQASLGLDAGALDAAVRRGRGSARDALSALDQVVASGSADAARPELSTVVDALAGGEATAVLVSLSTLLAGGWGPQQLATELIDDLRQVFLAAMATELIDDLRQVFLAAMAPELCAVSGPSLDRYTGLAETMGLARTVRSMEILGHALVDMREAPDIQVVLEIAVLRAVRPDLDSDLGALAERVSVLERSFSGAPAFPRPAPRTSAPPEASASPEPSVSPASSASPAPSAPPASGPDSLGGSAAPPISGDAGPRRTIGAVRRGKEAAQAAEVIEPVEAEPDQPAEAVESVEMAGSAEASARSHSRPDVATAVPAARPAAAGSPAIDRDGLTEAWGNGILQALPARVKARYASGRFVAVDEFGAHFALPNAAHRDQCLEHQALVEAALLAHVGSPVALVLVVEGRPEPPADPVGVGDAPGLAVASSLEPDGALENRLSGPGSGGPAGGRGGTPGRDAGDDPAGDPEDFDEMDALSRQERAVSAAKDDTAAAEARLLEAFPGASEVSP